MWVCFFVEDKQVISNGVQRSINNGELLRLVRRC